MVGFRGGEMANRRVFRARGKLLGNRYLLERSEGRAFVTGPSYSVN